MRTDATLASTAVSKPLRRVGGNTESGLIRRPVNPEAAT